jgi:serine/threonine protein kinase
MPSDDELHQFFLQKLCHVVKLMHACNVVHMDLMPCSIAWKKGQDGKTVHIKLLDFDAATNLPFRIGDSVVNGLQLFGLQFGECFISHLDFGRGPVQCHSSGSLSQRLLLEGCGTFRILLILQLSWERAAGSLFSIRSRFCDPAHLLPTMLNTMLPSSGSLKRLWLASLPILSHLLDHLAAVPHFVGQTTRTSYPC